MTDAPPPDATPADAAPDATAPDATTLLPGSERGTVPGAAPAGALTATASVGATLLLRRRAPLPAELVEGPRTIGRDELAASYGADPADVELVRAELTRLGLVVTAVDPGSRRVTVSGTVDQVGAAFGAQLSSVTSPDPVTGLAVAHRQRQGSLHVPAPLAGVVTAVLGLDDRPQAQTRSRIARAGSVTTSYTPPQLGTVYGFPPGTDGTGHTLAVVELGGGFGEQDLDTYFAGLGVPRPSVTAVGVDGAANQPGADPQGADGEVLLDVEVAGALAPGAAQVVYFAPNTDQGFVDAISTAVHADPTPTALSISWGQAEDGWTEQGRTAMDEAFADAAALGVTVCVAAGDGGSSDGSSDGRPHVDYPAASPYVLACGGTNLRADPATGAVRSESVWNGGAQGGATGGGVSALYPRPSWQAAAGVPARPGGGTGRGVPDVAADADPATGYRVRVDGAEQVIGGTSAVAPLWAALVCRLAQAAGRPLGLLQPTVYPSGGGTAPGFRDVVEGDNGAYAAGPGWDPCTGLGVPVGTELTGAFPPAGGGAGASGGGS